MNFLSYLCEATKLQKQQESFKRSSFRFCSAFRCACPIGDLYTRRQIHEVLKGGLQDYLPHRGQVVCDCFKEDANPDAPEIVLPGVGEQFPNAAFTFR